VARRDRRTTTAVGLDPDGDADLHGGGLALETEGPLPPTGPHDGDDLDPEITDAAGLVDFGSIRVPVPPDGAVTVEPTTDGRMQAVHIRLPEGRLSVSALAAPKTSRLWPELAHEIDASLREGGARVRSFTGDWGRELHATSGGATSVFIGVDGPRWMLYGIATGPSAHTDTLDAELRRMLRGTVVLRGKQPYPVRTILPLTVPDHLAAEAAETPVVPAPGAKKRSQATTAPGKSAPGKTAPPNSDAATAAAKKAAARRAAARKAAAAAALRAAAQALAEHAAQDDGAEAEEHPDTRRAARTGSYPVTGTIPTGPGPEAPLREQAPSARRAAAGGWRERPVAPESEPPPPTEALPVARPFQDPRVAATFPAEDLPPTEALRLVEPGTGGRRRLGEPAPPPPPGPRYLQEPPGEPAHPTGRRRLREPAPDLPPSRYRDAEAPANGRRRPAEPDGVLGATAPWDLNEPGGRRRLHEPVADSGVSASGRRRLREPWEADDAVSASGRRRLREPGAPAADTGVSASGRRRLREPWEDEAGRAGFDQPSGRRRLSNPAGDPLSTAADTGVSASGRRHLREPGPPVADSGVSASGRRRLREPWEAAPPPAFDEGVSATGRRRLREPWEAGGLEAPRRPDPAPLNGTGERPAVRRSRDPFGEPAPAGPVADIGVSASGRRRLREPWEGPVDPGVSGSGRRRLRDPWEETGAPVEPARRRPDLPPGDDRITGTGGRRRLREPEPPAAPPERSARRTLSAEYLIDTGEQDPGWASALDGYPDRPDGGRHSGADDPASRTVRVQALLGELDPNRPRRRHRR
jgi:Protein of unknown function (DUF3710)